MSTQENVTIDSASIERTYSGAEDFERSPFEPKTDVWYEFEVVTALRQVAKGGYLQVSMQVRALDANGEGMFTKFINSPLPVKYKGISPPEAAPGILRSLISTLYPNFSPYDAVKKNPANEKKRDYYKGGVKLDKEAFEAGEKEQSTLIKTVVDNLTDPAYADDALADFIGRRFFAKLSKDKTGQYVNVKPMVGILTEGEVVVYDPKVAFGRE